MKQIVVILFLLSINQCSGQSIFERPYSINNLISVNNSVHYNNQRQFNKNESPTPDNQNKTNQINYSIDLLGINRNVNFNLLKLQSMSFTWAEMEFYFQLDLFSTVGGMMQSLNLIQIQNQYSK